ncbi:unnamed protein product, partial [Porites evermanni]
ALQKEANGGVFNIMPYITLCALDVICITSMDASPNAQEDVDSPYVNAVLRVSELIQMRQRSPWLWNDTLYGLLPSGREHKRCLKILHDFTNKVIDQRIAERASIKSKTQEEKEKDEVYEDDGLYKRKKRLAFLDLLLESYDTGDISREGVREEVDTFMFEGHDTTAAAITWALYLLGRHPVIQRKVHEEVDSFLGEFVLSIFDDLKDLRYLECVIKEALRLFPSVPFFARTTTEDFHIDGYTAPKGTSVGIATLALHRNSDVWPAPLEFNPDRFLPENSQGRHSFAYIPFSAGPRNCIGQRFAFLEEKIVLCHVMRNFSIESAQTFDDLRTCGELITRPKEGIFVTLCFRSKKPQNRKSAKSVIRMVFNVISLTCIYFSELIKQMLGFTQQFQKEGLICIWLGPVYPITLLFKPEYAEILLSTSKHMGNGGSKWKTRRRLITPTFHFRILNDFIQVFEEQAAILVKHLEKEANGDVFNIMPYITLCALDVICITSMDASPNAQEDFDSPYANAVLRYFFKENSYHIFRPFLFARLVYFSVKTTYLTTISYRLFFLHDFTNKVIDQRIAERASIKSKTQEEETKEEVDEDDGLYKRKKRLAFLDLLLESYDTGAISREGVREEVDTFMFEGHDTTAAGITWALYLLGRHPVIQQKVHDEVDSFFEQRPETLSVDDLKDLRYLECVIKEALRLFPSVPFFARTTTEDFHMDGYTAPKGTSVGIATLALHRNSDVWPAPLEFNPDRFLPENSQGRHPFAYIPFSAGPRNCIGEFAFIL